MFLSLLDFYSLDEKNIYTDLLRSFKNIGHNLYVISPVEKRNKKKTFIIEQGNVKILKLRIGNTQKTNLIEKGISTLMIEQQFISGVKRYFPDIRFDLVLYSTPPVTFAKVIEFVKERDNAVSYLLLKDIFPQNAVDIGLLNKRGIKRFIYKVFRTKEKRLYAISDHIGCMSKANVDYILAHNLDIDPKKVHINPNSIEISEYNRDYSKKIEIYKKYNIPLDSTTFLYGGNLGKPQDIPFIIKCLKENSNLADRFFIICGSGTEYYQLEAYVKNDKPNNVLLINGLEKNIYDEFIKAFDVGLVFLDYRFTIPNFPSRMLSYMQCKMPVIAATDMCTDIGAEITKGEFGWFCKSNSVQDFVSCVDKAVDADLEQLGNKAYDYLCKNFSSSISRDIIIQCLKWDGKK